uniref:PIH1 domain-containing protein n=1 Tax=Rhabditophanes sp. KR3021 TaxID=114890 RepID=A0AC35U0Z3_9BILA
MGWCAKFKSMQFENGTIEVEGMRMKEQQDMKFFFNVCHCKEIPYPLTDYTEDEVGEMSEEELGGFKIPMSVSDVLPVKTPKGEDALKCDLLINTLFYEKRVKNSLFFRQLVIIIACSLLSDKHQITLDPSESVELKNKMYMGEVTIQKIRKTPAEPFIQDINEPKGSNKKDPKADQKYEHNFAEYEKIVLGKDDFKNVVMSVNQKERVTKMEITTPPEVHSLNDTMVKMNEDHIVIIANQTNKIADFYSCFTLNSKEAQITFDEKNKLITISAPINLPF